MDKIFFTGRLGADPEKKTSKGGTEYCTMRVAVTHYRGQEKTTEWRSVTAFGKNSEFCLKYLHKGMAVTVVGEPSVRAYVPKSGGDPVGVMEIVVERVEGSGGQSDGGNSGQADSGGAGHGMTDVSGQVDDELPF